AALMDLHESAAAWDSPQARALGKEILVEISEGLGRDMERYRRAVNRMVDYGEQWMGLHESEVMHALYRLDAGPLQLGRLLEAAGAPEPVVRAARNNYVEWAGRQGDHADWVAYAVGIRDG